MNRRNFIQSAVYLAVAPCFSILPAKRRTIDLMTFCAKENWPSKRYDMTSPFVQDDWTFATDSRVCVRVRPERGDVKDKEIVRPPASQLVWDHDSLTGWKTAKPKILMAEDECPKCDGSGVEGPFKECGACNGFGCHACNMSGVIEPGPKCSMCGGSRIGIFPSIVDVCGQFIDRRFWDKVATLGEVEAVARPLMVGINTNATLVKIRFDGGMGLLATLDPVTTRKRLAS